MSSERATQFEDVATTTTASSDEQKVLTKSKRGAKAQLIFALVFLAVGQALIFIRWRPISDFYFILVWVGYIAMVDYLVYRRSGRSLLRDAPVRFLLMFPISSLFWWVFEFYNQFLDNWRYHGSTGYSGMNYLLVASLFFSVVVPAVWETADLLMTFLNKRGADRPGQTGSTLSRLLAGKHAPTGARDAASKTFATATWLPLVGILLAILPIVAPTFAFPLVWVGLFVILDPINARAGRPSIFKMLAEGQWRVPVAFYVGTTITGFFWEFWNYWASPKWEYVLHPIIASAPHLFEMPLPGYLGYGPFGWELFAMWWFFVGLASAVRPPRQSHEAIPTSRTAPLQD